MSCFSSSILSVFALAVAELTQQRLLKNKNPFSARASAVLIFLSSIAMIFYLKSFKVKNISISAIFVIFGLLLQFWK